MPDITRRAFLKSVSGLALTPLFSAFPAALFAENEDSPFITKAIPVSAEPIPVIGMGTWQTFDVGDDSNDRARCVQILDTFFQRGGGMIDSSPMYGSSQEVIGHCLAKLKPHPGLFSATKVWIIGRELGENQMGHAQYLWGLPGFDLMQIHNLLDWRTHLETLKEWKHTGRIRYIGITTSHGRRHKELEQALLEEDFDFVQFTYNVVDREVEQRLLPLAKERGVAVIINRPFQRGALIDRIQGKPLPEWGSEIDCNNWPQFLLKFIVSHPAVTCAIPATSQIVHMQENMGACYGKLPDQQMREKMISYFNSVV